MVDSDKIFGTEITCGSAYFFEGMDGYMFRNKDTMIIVEKGDGFNYIQQVQTGDHNLFKIVYRPKQELIEYTLERAPGAALGKFLIPEFDEIFGITLEDLKQLEPLLEKLKEEQAYEKVIYDAYFTNGSLTLTDEQRKEALKSYNSARNIDDEPEIPSEIEEIPEEIPEEISEETQSITSGELIDQLIEENEGETETEETPVE
jgi:hypothetical protein